MEEEGQHVADRFLKGQKPSDVKARAMSLSSEK